MKFEKPVSARWVGGLIAAKIIGDPSLYAFGISEIHYVAPGDIVYVDNAKYYKRALQSDATHIIIDQEVACPIGKVLLVVRDPLSAYNKIIKNSVRFQPSFQAISPTAIIGEATTIDPGCFIGHNVIIGERCMIHSKAIIGDGCVIGNDVIIHAGVVLGADATYYKRRIDTHLQHDRMLSCGSVFIDDHVEIGNLSTIDRGVTSITQIGKGTKIAGQVHIGHDTKVGQNCVIESHVGIAGTVIIEDSVIIESQVGINKEVTIPKGAKILFQSGVPISLEESKVYIGTPAIKEGDHREQSECVKSLPNIWNAIFRNAK